MTVFAPRPSASWKPKILDILARRPELLERAIYLIVGLMVTLIVGLNFFILREADSVQASLRAMTSNEEEASRRLADLHAAIGYGGMIHSFKNYVIRRDEAFLGRAREKLKDAREHLGAYELLIESPDVMDAVHDLRATLRSYETRLFVAEDALANGLTLKQVDDLVRVDDTAALAALEVLATRAAAHYFQVRTQANTTIDKIASWANLVLIAVPAFIVLGIAGWFLGRALSSKNRHLAAVGAEFSELFELSPDALIALDKNGDVKRVNQKAVELTGYERSHLSNLNISQLVSTFAVSDHSKLSALWEGALDKDLSERTTSEIALTRKSGDAIEVEVELSKLTERGHDQTLVSLRDVTERNLLRESLARGQKLEALRELTGGIAHDFNNLLSVIVGNLGFISAEKSLSMETYQAVETAESAALRASQITEKLMNVVIGQDSSLNEPVDLPSFLDEARGLLDSVLGSKIRLCLEIEDTTWPIFVNPNDFEDALLNLVLNAKDAMPDGGTLTIRSRNLMNKVYRPKNRAPVSADMVQISVTDTGTGIEKESISRIFDPFFTSKAFGEGSGLGLTMVQRFVLQAEGIITVESHEGVGTCFLLRFPRLQIEECLDGAA